MPGLSLTQSYTYDHLNRLTQAQETGGSANWSQAYNYDVLGNRWIPQNQSTGLPNLPLETPVASSWYSTTLPNRYAAWTYDNAGNVLQMGSVVNSFTYDGENRQVTACFNCAQGSPTGTYVYDGLGQRVSKTANGQTTTYVYDAWGNVAAEYSTGTPTSACGTPTCYVTTDHLGSTRMLTSSAGAVGSRYDYQPFGLEIPAGYDGRTTGLGFLSTPDATNPKYTGQERDQETTLDNFLVRYYDPAQGRFQGPDPGNAGADPASPQTWNGFGYVANNPLSYTDPSGQCWWCDLIGGILDAVGVLTLDPGLIAGGEAAIGISGGVIGASAITVGNTVIGLGAAGTIGGGSSPGNVQSPGGQAGSSPFGLPGQGGCPLGPFANCLAPNPLTIGQTLWTYTTGLLPNLLGAAGLVFTTAGQTQQYEAIWLRTGRLPGMVPLGPTMSGSKGGKQKVSHDWVADKAQQLFPDDDICTALKKLMDRARKAGDSKTFNAAKATWKQMCRGN